MDLTPDQVKAILMKTSYKDIPQFSAAFDPATRLSDPSQYEICAVGAGYPDIAAALASNDIPPATPGSALSPTAVNKTINGIPTVCRLDCGSTAVWGWTAVWGSISAWRSSNQDAVQPVSIAVNGER